MSSLFGWIKKCFNYYILGVQEELMAKISDEKTNISPEVKEDLLKSIMLNKPTQLVEQINDENNHIPQDIKDDLMKSIMRASQMYAQPIDQQKPQTQDGVDDRCCNDYPPTDEIVRDTPVAPKSPVMSERPIHIDFEDEKRHFARTVPELPVKIQKLKRFDDDLITARHIIPSDQFVPVQSDFIPEILPLSSIPVSKNWKKMYGHVIDHIKLRQFIKGRRQDITDKKCIIHTGKIIPSGQYKPSHFPIQRYQRLDCHYIEKDWTRAFNRVLAQLSLKLFIRNRRQALQNVTKMEEHKDLVKPDGIIHTGKLIPSGHYAPRKYPIGCAKRFRKHISPRQKNWKKTFNLVMNQLKFKQFIKERTTDAIISKENIQFCENFQRVMASLRFRSMLLELKNMRARRETHNINHEVILLDRDEDFGKHTHIIHRKNNRHDKNNYKPYQMNKRNSPTNNYRILKMDCKWNQHY